MILEGLLLTTNGTGQLNLAPMGPIVESSEQSSTELKRFILRPFYPSTTLANLQAVPQATFHTTDDVLLLARAALKESLPEPFALPPIMPLDTPATGYRLVDCCQWWSLGVLSIDAGAQRATIVMQAGEAGIVRPFAGFQRARHAVLEAIILATRTSLLEPAVIWEEIRRWQPLVDKTGGPREREAWELVTSIIEQRLANRSSSS
ncbi:DUF447 domain-containing protein [Planctopirus hydrillae]|uniref:DUF447 domain-containing protein n=1 Tax=Planctopirus hydrillae TaxID=1841610 RepID=A0A1C3EQM5_9PLAN|nr:DUF447 domain-containing protein [Planctopirus hydrillae]ODA35547.1 hypothetical protein A6X21_16565 [Planctopirus hydrillae]